ncbi:MAG: endonuclease/exonuclease/phosphatase family protein [Pseudomonadota bacterium]
MTAAALLGGVVLTGALAVSGPVAALDLTRTEGALRVATFNASLVRQGAGVLIADMDKRDAQVIAVAEIILRVRPDILLINEIDHDPEGLAVARLQALLAEGMEDIESLEYPHSFTDTVNTGVPSGFDLDGNGEVTGARDAWGFGRFPGQYGMAVLSRYRIADVRTFRLWPWSQVPQAREPMNPDGNSYYAAEVWDVLPLSSKSHWDVKIETPGGPVHVLASHPTPPVFDGPENRNGLRNAAEIAFWISYLEGEDWMIDDAGLHGPIGPDAQVIVLGDLNADPLKGDGDNATIAALIGHPRLQDPLPVSPGAAQAAVGAEPQHNTADWPENNGPGDLRVDYVLPSAELEVSGAGVFWPSPDDPLSRLTELAGRRHASSDHRLVWVDLLGLLQ